MKNTRSAIQLFANKHRLKTVFEVKGDDTPVIKGENGTIWQYEPGRLALDCGDREAMRQAGFQVGTGYAVFNPRDDKQAAMALEAAKCPVRPKRVLSAGHMEALAAGLARYNKVSGTPTPVSGLALSNLPSECQF